MSARRSKYGAVAVVDAAGERWDSRGEHAYAAVLDPRVAAGELRAWRRGQPWLLVASPSGRRLTYRPDYEVVRADGARYCLDFKGGPVTEAFRIKAVLWETVYPGVPLYVVRADGVERPA